MIAYHIWYISCTLKIIVRRGFWTSKEVYWERQGAIIFFQIGGHEKAGSHRFFSVKNIGVSTWNKQEIIGWLQVLLKFVFNDNPLQIFHATRNEGCRFVYNKVSCNFWLSNMGSQKYCLGTFGISWAPYSKENGDLIIHLFMCFLFCFVFLINPILRNMIYMKFNLAIYSFIFSHQLLLLLMMHCKDELVSTYSIKGLKHKK